MLNKHLWKYTKGLGSNSYLIISLASTPVFKLMTFKLPSLPVFPPKRHTQLTSCLLDFSTWMFHW